MNSSRIQGFQLVLLLSRFFWLLDCFDRIFLNFRVVRALKRRVPCFPCSRCLCLSYISPVPLAFPSHSSPCSPQLKMSTETAAKKLLQFTLKANDGEKITVPEDAAFQSNLLKKMVSDLGISSSEDAMLSEALPVSNVDGWALKKILDWCETHRGETYKPKEEHEDPRIRLTEADKEYLDVTSEQLYSMLMVRLFLYFPVKETISGRQLPGYSRAHRYHHPEDCRHGHREVGRRDSEGLRPRQRLHPRGRGRTQETIRMGRSLNFCHFVILPVNV